MVPELRSSHMCRNSTNIQEWVAERWVPLYGKQKHVENGTVVDYAGEGQDPEKMLEAQLLHPKDWNKTIHDL